MSVIDGLKETATSANKKLDDYIHDYAPVDPPKLEYDKRSYMACFIFKFGWG